MAAEKKVLQKQQINNRARRMDDMNEWDNN